MSLMPKRQIGFRTAAARADYWGQLALDRLHRLFAIVILLQLIQCFRGYWWSETYSVIYGVVTAIAVSELLFTRWLGIRLALQAAAAVVLSAAYSPFFEWAGWPSDWKDQQQWSLFYDFHIASLHPFVELAAGAVLAVHVMTWFARTRTSLVSLLMAAIGVMATVDSFFPLELWHNIAWIVAAGLGWLVILHLRELRARHPDSWEALAERPIDLAVPAVIIIGLLLLTGIFMPRAPAILEDPYTIWSEAQGRSVPSAAGEGGQLTTSIGASSVKNGSSSSGYGRDDRTLGGGFDFDYSPVMTVATNRRSYWRGEAKAVYTGQGWGDVRRPLSLLGAGVDTRFGVSERAETVKTEKLTQTVTMLRKDRVPVLFGAGPVSKIDELESDNNGGVQLNPEDWEVRFNKPSRVTTYTIESDVTVFDPAALRAAAVPAPDAASIDLSPYLQLPGELPARVKNLALQVTASGANEFDKTELLVKYLKETYPYNNKPDVSKRKSSDFVDAFLFEIKEGYCDYYSTAFVVMARSVGIPARWVKGYTSGVDPAQAEEARYAGAPVNTDGPGTYTVRNSDAHSWAEVYFEGYGWIPFEPTAGFSVPQPVPVDAPADLSAEPVDAPEADEADKAPVAIGWQIPAAGAALLLVAAIAVLLRKRRGIRLWKRIRYAGASPDQRIVRETEKLVKFLGRRGMKREDHETMRESFNRWGDKFTSLRPDFDRVLIQFERARYGRGMGAEQDAKQVEETVARLRKAL
ncbi:transglutaminase TgpA family protein [Cohnella caldifontis]|uniref:transglutaminase TgpA family protein n=1 Tax=Cohnella caldifontis TaxID=3027471 RepID=UPI0023ED082B|nr:transglutaminase domain-containing protein [Cohnella sp. YIM B05605]